MIIENRKTIKRSILFLLAVFSGFSIIMISLAKYTQNIWVIKYPLIFTFSMTIFCTIVLILIEYIKQFRENKFFTKDPYTEIERITIDITKVQKSKFEFLKTQRIVKLKEKKYVIEYYDDIIKNPIGEILLVINESDKNAEPGIINYKNEKLSKDQLLKRISEV